MKDWQASMVFILVIAGCAAPLRTSVAPFRAPEFFPIAQTLGGHVVAADLLDTREKSRRVFGIDLEAADILPVQLVVKNTGSQEYEINAAQVYGMTQIEYFPAFNLIQAAQRVRESSIGTTVATQAVLGALATATAGVAIGAAAGGAAGASGKSAAYGAAIGGAVGTTAGAAAGASDRYTHQFRHELAVQDFGDRVIFPGDLMQEFIYFQLQPYRALRIKVMNISERKTQEIEIPVAVAFRGTR